MLLRILILLFLVGVSTPLMAFSPDTLQMKADISVLASDSLEGRASGTIGNLKARSYIVKRLSELGYNVIFDQFLYKDSLPLCNVYAVRKGKSNAGPLVIGAHYDHLGVKNGEIYTGADDNASGVATVLQLAKEFSESRKPSRSVVFAFWDGEELGVLGSYHYAQNHKNDSILAYINFDMVGRNDDKSVVFHFSKGKTEFKKWLEEAIKKYRLIIRPSYSEWDLKAGSDNYSFAVCGIPCLWWSTDGHPDFHKPTDSESKINYPKMIEITKSASYVSRKLVF